LTAQERIDLLLDPGSQTGFGMFAHSPDLSEAERTAGNGSLMGFGTIDGRPVAYSATDATIKGGSGGPFAMRRNRAFRDFVDKCGLPEFHLGQSGGARITDVLSSRFPSMGGTAVGLDRHLPHRSTHFEAVLGNAYGPWVGTFADFNIMTRTSNISISSPGVIEVSTGQKVTDAELGGVEIQTRLIGQVDAVAEDDADLIRTLRRVFSYYPGNPEQPAPVVRGGDPVDRIETGLRTVLPANPNRAYDVRKIITTIVDRQSFFEWSPEFARNLVTGLARMDGHTIGIIANQSMHMAGVFDIGAAIKSRRMLTVCATFGFPVLWIQDVPGVMPTREQEHQRIIVHVLEHAVARHRVRAPQVALVVRKGIGHAYFEMNASNPEIYTIAWPTAQVAFIGPEPGVKIAFRREMEAAPDPQAYLIAKADEFRKAYEPWDGAHLGYFDDVFDPAETRPAVIRAFASLRKR
jgi:acetyl-CoA carboxylase carboxyltransferase component